MKLDKRFGEKLLAHMGVPIGRGDASMPQQLLNDTQIGSIFKQVGCKAVA